MDNYTLFLIKDNKAKHNITNLISNLSWSDNIDTLGTQLSFDFTRNREDSFLVKKDLVETGDKLILTNNNKEIFRGIITDLDWSRYGRLQQVKQ